MELLLKGVAIGTGATVLMDLWAIFLWKALGQARPNWAPVGRWFWHLKNGTVFHDDIGRAEPYASERALGWIGHYAVGILYGVVLALIVGSAWFAAPTFLPAWVLGIGVAASRLPNANKVRFLNLVAHTVFALGLYGTALLLR